MCAHWRFDGGHRHAFAEIPCGSPSRRRHSGRGSSRTGGGDVFKSRKRNPRFCRPRPSGISPPAGRVQRPNTRQRRLATAPAVRQHNAGDRSVHRRIAGVEPAAATRSDTGRARGRAIREPDRSRQGVDADHLAKPPLLAEPVR
jgi:hypothetical protein